MSDTSGSEPSAPEAAPNIARTDEDIQVAADKWCENPIEAEAIYGHISFWDVSTITSMRELFYDKESFNEDLSRWNVSACTDMSHMFCGASSFTSDLSEWSTGNVKSMEGMFYGASSFTSDLSEWSTGKVESMYAMFANASSFNSDLSEWIVMEGTYVYDMFNDCPCDDFRPVWKERRQVQKAKDECWERRLPWMVANAPYLQGERRTEAPIQMVYDIDGLFEFITTYI